MLASGGAAASPQARKLLELMLFAYQDLDQPQPVVTLYGLLNPVGLGEPEACQARRLLQVASVLMADENGA